MSKATKTAASESKDVVLVHGKTEDGGYRVLRKKDDGLYLGEMRSATEGKPISPGGELVSLEARDEAPNLFDVKTLWKQPGSESSDPAAESTASADDEKSAASAAPRLAADGPAQVTTEAYRDGFRAIWGSPRRRKKSQPN